VSYARGLGRPVVLLDEALGESAVAELIAMGVAVYRSLADLDLDAVLARTEVVVPSPGVPFSHPVLLAAAEQSIPVRSEIDLAVEQAQAPIVAVTGTNGKTTVTAMLEAIFRADGREVVAAGNYGTPLLDVAHEDLDVIVAEVSSFQLQFTHDPAFRVAVWLNIAEDHLDWHGDMDHYAAAKARILNGQSLDDLFVFNLDDPIVCAWAERATGRSVGFSTAGVGDGYQVRGSSLLAPDGTALMDLSELPSQAPHDIANVLAAVAAARDLGVPDDIIVETVQRFTKLPHRVQWICEAGGVAFVDDSKATNPHAARAAIAGFDSVVLIAGGKNKGLDLGVLRLEASKLRGVVAIGEAAGEVVAALGDLAPTTTARSMREAVRGAAKIAEPGDTVLLAPACASFDWYGGYAERGDDFAAEALAYAQGQLG